MENLLTKYFFTFRFRLNDPIAPYIRSFSSEVDIYKINRKVIFDLLNGRSDDDIIVMIASPAETQLD